MAIPRKITIAKLSIRKLGSLSYIVSIDEDLSLRIESFAIINLRGVSTKLNYTYGSVLFRNTLFIKDNPVTIVVIVLYSINFSNRATSHQKMGH